VLELCKKLKEVNHIAVFNFDELKKCRKMLEALIKDRLDSQKKQ
jgi:hypothetical protein